MTQAVERLNAAGVTMTDGQGNGLELSPVGASGTRLIATTDRLRVGDAGTLTARVYGDDLRPWVVGFEVESAEYQTDELARVTLRARSIKLDARQRQADRTAMGGRARLIAYSCQNVVDGDVVEGSIVDLSDNGVAFTTRRLLRPGDRLSFAGRFFATVVEAEVRVARVTEVAGQLQVGCTFIAIEAAERKKLRAVTAVRPPGEDASFNVLQQLNAERAAREQEQSGSRWRRLFRRSA
jgi:PilZ domain